MKLSIKKTVIWGIWFLVLVVLIICFTLQNTQIGRPLMHYLLQSIIFCSIPYIFFTTFYVIAAVTKQYGKMLCVFIIDIVSSIAIIENIGYFYEGTWVARNSFMVIIGLILIKGIILLSKRRSIEP